MLQYYPILIPLAPLLAAIYSAIPRQDYGEKTYTVGVLLHVVAFVVAIVTLGQVATSAGISLEICKTPWSFLRTIELSIDRLSAVMMVVISGIGLVLYRYSIRYLQSESGQPRYLTLLALTISTLLVMVSSNDLILLFLAWQLLSWLLCLLAYNYSHLPTARSSFRTFIMLRAGDLAFLAGILLANQWFGTVELSQLFKNATNEAKNPIMLHPFGPGFGISKATAVTLLIFIGAMSKSAQFPLHMWLPDSLFAPTPIHGLLHAGIINAGGFLLTHLAPLYVLSTPTLHLVFAVGLVTAVLGTSMMLVQNDIKKSLGYSTIGQMGYMIMECGVGAFSLAIFHLIAHGLFKATIFLNCGNVIHETREEPKRPPQPGEKQSLGAGNWAFGFFISLALPLVILFGAHELLHVPLRDSQGLVIFLFFSWVTASQAMLTVYRLRGTTAIKPLVILLILLIVFTSLYLFAAEQFTRFLYPDRQEEIDNYTAAALPDVVFIAIVVIAAAVVIAGWIVGYARRQGRKLPQPQKGHSILTTLYLFFMNRLYLDGVALRLRHAIKHTFETLDRSRFFLPILALIGIVLGWDDLSAVTTLSPGKMIALLLVAIALPLFPLQGGYVGVITRLPRVPALLLSVALPIAGAYGLTKLLPDLPATIRTGLAMLALIGAIYASIKAVVQNSASHLIAYAGLAYYSILWWHLAIVGKFSHDATVYLGAVLLVTGGMLWAWDRLRIRYGNLPLNKIGGLARPMPRFGLCLALLVMAAVGLPPFGLIFAYIGVLVEPFKEKMSSGTAIVPLQVTFSGPAIVLLAWFGTSWYMFKLMQRLLFGPHREDLRYDDLKPVEISAFAVILSLLLLLSFAPSG